MKGRRHVSLTISDKNKRATNLGKKSLFVSPQLFHSTDGRTIVTANEMWRMIQAIVVHYEILRQHLIVRNENN